MTRPWMTIAISVALSALPGLAWACGACFAPLPPSGTGTQLQILQEAERVLFVRNAKTKQSIVWVEIKYDGPATGFGWVLPVPKMPKVGVGTSYLFDRLDAGTAPRFTVTAAASENCRGAGSSSGGGGLSCGDGSPSSSESGGTGTGASAGVQVLIHSQTGPYDYQIIQGNDGAALFEWLNANKFAQPEAAKAIIASHVQKGDLFVAVKLAPGAAVSEIKPISLTMDDAEPCIPLRLTSVAAVEDTTVVGYIAGPGRAIPKNHLHVQLNPLRLNWLDGAANYAQVLSQAMDEAAGRAFVTEFSGTLPKTVVGPPPSAYQAGVDEPLFDMTRLQATPFAQVADDCAVVGVLKNHRLPIASDSAAILEKHTGLAGRAGRTDLVAFYSGIEANKFSVACGPQPVDGKALAAQLDAEFVAPLQATVPLLTAQAKFSRLAMRISPTEMTKDPVFAFSTTLPDVSRDHTATLASVCRQGDLTVDAERLTIDGFGSYVLPNSQTGAEQGFDAKPGTSATDPRWKDAPAALLIEVLDEQGPAVTVAADQIALVDAAIAGAHEGQPSLPTDLKLKSAGARWKAPASDAAISAVREPSDPGGCATEQRTRNGLHVAGMLLAVAATVAWRRRMSLQFMAKLALTRGWRGR